MSSKVTVRYRFHPLCGKELEVLANPRTGDAITVKDLRGYSLKIPRWMLSLSAEAFELSIDAEADVPVLLSIVRMIAETSLPSKLAGEAKREATGTGHRKRVYRGTRNSYCGKDAERDRNVNGRGDFKRLENENGA